MPEPNNPSPMRRSESRMMLWLIAFCVSVFAIAWFVFSRDQKQPTSKTDPVVNSSGPPNGEQSGPVWLRDVIDQSGVQFTCRNDELAGHFSILDTLGGGVGLLDYDGDGLLDIFMVGGGFYDGPDKKTIRGHPCILFRNLGNMKFEEITIADFKNIDFYSHGIAIADYDCDGWQDLLVTGYGQIKLFRNVANGKNGRQFEDVTVRVGLRSHSWNSSAGWGDLDGDGYPDLYVCRYIDWSFANNPVCKGIRAGVERDVCPPQRFKPLTHTLYRNRKGKSFEDVSSQHGFKASGCGLGVLLGDLNGDGRPDLYVGNDASLNFMFMNRPNGMLEEVANSAGTAGSESGHYDGTMGVDMADYDGSSKPSLFASNFQGDLHALYKNLGNERFQHHSRASGIGAIGTHYVGFGTGFFDIDNDGWEDLVIVNGHVLFHPALGSTYKQRPVLLRNVEFEGRRFFKDISQQGGGYFQKPELGRGLAIGDLDNDGWPDLVVSHTNSPVAILRNEAAATNPHHWLGVKLVGKNNRDIVGSTVILEFEGTTRKLTRFAKGGGSYLSSSDRRLLFGLGTNEQVKRITVKWSWGEAETWENLAPDRYWELQEGNKTPKLQFPKKK